MTPHLHPRSRLTTSLFGTTLLVSFLVVGMPHILPCPAPRVRYADSEIDVTGDGRRRRPRRSSSTATEGNSEANIQQLPSLRKSQEERELMKKRAHECPVPKPTGLLGKVLGFKPEDQEEKVPRPRLETQRVSRACKEDT